jgi:hypothetical protein
MSVWHQRKYFKQTGGEKMDNLQEDLVYEEKLDQISDQLEELILDAMLSALEKLNKRKEMFLESAIQEQAAEIRF